MATPSALVLLTLRPVPGRITVLFSPTAHREGRGVTDLVPFLSYTAWAYGLPLRSSFHVSCLLPWRPHAPTPKRTLIPAADESELPLFTRDLVEEVFSE